MCCGSRLTRPSRIQTSRLPAPNPCTESKDPDWLGLLRSADLHHRWLRTIYHRAVGQHGDDTVLVQASRTSTGQPIEPAAVRIGREPDQQRLAVVDAHVAPGGATPCSTPTVEGALPADTSKVRGFSPVAPAATVRLNGSPETSLPSAPTLTTRRVCRPTARASGATSDHCPRVFAVVSPSSAAPA